jgi:hypothetical protein
MAASTPGLTGASDGTPPQQAAEGTLGQSQATSSGEDLLTAHLPLVVGAAFVLGIPGDLAHRTHTTEPLPVPICRT